ncbi:MAG: PKD domain-containing protein [Planctomycetaceae bacterium]|nr:PKD domain-containing protein [Planctomycetaceae bacterium]
MSLPMALPPWISPRVAVLWALSLVAFFAPIVHSPHAATAQLPPALPPMKAIEALPEKSPEWLAGYQVRYLVRCLGNMANSKSQSIVARIPTGTWLRQDGLDVAVQAADGTAISVAVLSHATTGDTLIQFPRHGNDQWYWVYAINPSAPAATGKPMPEGLTLEAMTWTGGDLSSWTTVREALTKLPVVANGFVGEIFQKANPVRPDIPKNYAVTYRGHLKIKTDGVYRFYVNSEDASYLFIDGFKVCDRSGSNNRVTGNIPTKSVGVDVELKAGVHPIEVYHVLVENPNTYGGCILLWVPPGAKAWEMVGYQNFVQPDLALVSTIEAAGPSTCGVVEYGVDDVLVTPAGTTMHLVKFEATGDLPDEKSLTWDFGDGTKGTGRSVRHVYFTAGDYNVTLGGTSLPAYQRRVSVWAAPGAISPFSVEAIIETLQSSDWRSLPAERLDQVFDFLNTCDDPARWPFLVELARERLKVTGTDPQFRAQMYRTLIEALGHTGKPGDLVPVLTQASTEFAKLPSLLVGVQLAEATVQMRQFNNTDDAAKRFEEILQKHRRLEHPDMRWVAIRYGDLLSEQGDLKAAADMYRTAATLGGEAFLATAQTEAISRGALLRLAEQKLRNKNVAETRQLLSKIELQFPDQKMEGLYRFLRAESDRFGGRYEEALRSYEVLLQLQQWAGYRDKAMLGVADCQARMDQVDKALETLARLEKAFPAFFEKQGLNAQRLVLTSRQEFLKSQGSDGPAKAKNQDTATRFEPDESEPFGQTNGFHFVRGLGLSGPHIALDDSHPAYRGYVTYTRPLPQLTPGGYYWIEYWVREDLFSILPGFNPHTQVYLFGPGNQTAPDYKGLYTHYYERNLGAWRKVGCLLNATTVNEGRVHLNTLFLGSLQLDDLKVRFVSDRRRDALSNFIEGPGEGESP